MAKCYGLRLYHAWKSHILLQTWHSSFLQSWRDLLPQSAYALTTTQIRGDKNTQLYWAITITSQWSFNEKEFPKIYRQHLHRMRTWHLCFIFVILFFLVLLQTSCLCFSGFKMFKTSKSRTWYSALGIKKYIQVIFSYKILSTHTDRKSQIKSANLYSTNNWHKESDLADPDVFIYLFLDEALLSGLWTSFPKSGEIIRQGGVGSVGGNWPCWKKWSKPLFTYKELY